VLSAIVFLPLVGAIVIASLRPLSHRWIRYVATAVTLADLVLVIIVFTQFDLTIPGMQLVERVRWIPSFNIYYFLGVDGLSLPLVLLTALLGLCAVFVSWHIEKRLREYFVWLLTLQTAVAGVFLAQDFVLFFIFWELELLPMFMLISVWGTGRCEYSAMKFLLFTALGSAFMFAGLLILYFSTGTFDMVELARSDLGNLLMPTRVVFLFFLIPFAIKLPVWPFHTWLPDAHTDAPTAVSVMLAGVLLKMGGYGLLRICIGMFPGQAAGLSLPLAILGAIGVLYGALIVLRQTDLKRLVAYSSISHMGLVLIGISSVGAAADKFTSIGLNGAALQLFSHGVVTGLLFLLVGLVYERTHTRHIPDLGGLATRMPIIAVAMLVAGLASLGLPSTSGFAAEFLIFVGAFEVWRWPTVLSAIGIILAAGYILWMVQRTMFGPRPPRYDGLRDASLVDMIPIVLLVVAIMVVGIYPAIITDYFESGLASIVSRFG
jgi:NADH-quinone oxidoreductase subunit M